MSASVERRRAVVLYSKMFKIEYGAVIKFLTRVGKSPAEIKQRLDAVYGESSPSYWTVKEWAQRFNLGRESIEDDPCQGRPAEALAPETTALVQEVLENRRLKTKEMSGCVQFYRSRLKMERITHLSYYEPIKLLYELGSLFRMESDTNWKIATEADDFSSSLFFETCSGVHPHFFKMDTQRSFKSGQNGPRA
jgi:transposase